MARAVPANGAAPADRTSCAIPAGGCWTGTVHVVIGYGQSAPAGPAYPVFITRPEDVDQLVWNDRCLANLTVYLNRKEIRALGKAAIVVKGCDERALVVLEKESQIDRVGNRRDRHGLRRHGPAAEVRDVRRRMQPAGRDVVIGEARSASAADSAERSLRCRRVLPGEDAAERLAYWRQELARCVKCYACRQVCPMCYCPRCIVDKNRPQAISTSATLKGNFAWHITRAFHLAGALRGLRRMHAGLSGGHRPAVAESVAGPGGGREFRLSRRHGSQAEPVIGSLREQDQEELHPMSEVISPSAALRQAGRRLDRRRPSRGRAAAGADANGDGEHDRVLTAGWTAAEHLRLDGLRSAGQLDQGIPLPAPRKALRLPLAGGSGSS